MNIYAFSTLFNGNEMIRRLIDNNIKIDGIIGFENIPAKQHVSGFESPSALCMENNIKFIPVKSYNLMHEDDKRVLSDLNIDIALILGWQRLIPKWLIEKFNHGGVGVHGSYHGINNGRGRSPQNWALIFGRTEFHLSVFQIDSGIDSGPIIMSESLPLSLIDDIKTSHLKIGIATAELITRYLNSENLKSWKCIKQKKNARYYPKRIPADGQIDWNRPAVDIYNFVRALTKPYPGAFTYFGATQINIWKARPFEINFKDSSTEPGKILHKFENGSFLVATRDNPLLIESYDSSNKVTEILKGVKLTSCSYKNQMKEISNRHYNDYPNLKLAEEFDDYS